MLVVWLIVRVAALILAGWLIGRLYLNWRQRRLKLEQRLAALQACGIVLNPGYTSQSLERLYDRKDLDRMGYAELLSVLGGSPDDEPSPPFCDQLYAFDTECVEDAGAYAEVLGELARFSGGALAISQIVDEIEYGQGAAELKFICNAERVTLQLKQEDDWFDVRVIDALATLLARSGADARYFVVDTGDQIAAVGCLPAASVARLKRLAPEVIDGGPTDDYRFMTVEPV